MLNSLITNAYGGSPRNPRKGSIFSVRATLQGREGRQGSSQVGDPPHSLSINELQKKGREGRFIKKQYGDHNLGSRSPRSGGYIYPTRLATLDRKNSDLVMEAKANNKQNYE